MSRMDLHRERESREREIERLEQRERVQRDSQRVDLHRERESREREIERLTQNKSTEDMSRI